MGNRSPASHLVQSVRKGTSGNGMLSVYAQDGHVYADFGGIVLKLPPEQARWVSAELQAKAFLVDGRAI